LLAQDRDPRQRIPIARRPLKGRFAPKGVSHEGSAGTSDALPNLSS
jgi:hypothetical protein